MTRIEKLKATARRGGATGDGNAEAAPPEEQHAAAGGRSIDQLLDEAEAQAEAESKLSPEEARLKLLAAGITFVDAADFMAQKLPQPKWIVRDFVAQGMKGDLCGGSKTLKTRQQFLSATLVA